MNLLKILITMLLFTSVSVSAEDITLPVISRPSELLEGTDRTLTLEQIELLAPWANDSKTSLSNLLKDIEDLSVTEKAEILIEEIKKIVSASAGKNSELFMRYTLNRALVINEMLDKEILKDHVGASDVKLRLLLSSVKMALRYHSTDIAILTKKEHSPYAVFGIEYFNFLVHLNKSIFDATLQHTIAKTALEWLQWDLYRDISNTKYAVQIVKINNFLKKLPKSIESDQKAIGNLKQIKNFVATLDILKSIEDETEQIIGTTVTYKVLRDYYLTTGPNTNDPVLGFISEGTKVQIIGSRIKGQLFDVVKVKIVKAVSEERQYLNNLVNGDVGYLPMYFIEKPVDNPIAFGQLYHVNIGGLLMKSTCGTVKKLGYRDVTMIEDGSIVKILDTKVVGFNEGMFVIVDNRFVKVKILKGSTKEGYATTDCEGYAPLRLLEPEI